jgi:DNA-directed RNA polymerase specialized sigma24 family protein
MMGAVALDEPDGLHDRWRRGDRDDRALFLVLRGPMRRAAAGAIRRMTGGSANAEDVDEAVVMAFTELVTHDPDAIATLVGFAARIAWRRGQDVGRRLNRAREHPDSDTVEALGAGGGIDDRTIPDPEGELLAAERFAERERTFQLAMLCVEQLPPGQAEVVAATVLRGQELAAWAGEQGKSYQAAHKQRAKALRALNRCVEARRRDEHRRDSRRDDGDQVSRRDDDLRGGGHVA